MASQHVYGRNGVIGGKTIAIREKDEGCSYNSSRGVPQGATSTTELRSTVYLFE